MADTASAIMLTRLQSTGSNNNIWGGYLVDNQNITERQSQGYSAIALTADQTISYTNYATNNIGQDRTVKFTGALAAAVTVTYPALKAFRTFINTSGAAVTVKCAAGTGVSIPNGYSADLYCDGVDYYQRSAITVNGELTVAGKIHTVTAGTANTDAVNVIQMTNAISVLVGTTAGLVLNSVNDLAAKYLQSALTAAATSGILLTPSSVGTVNEYLAAALYVSGLTALTEDFDPAADYVPIYNGSTATHQKALGSQIVSRKVNRVSFFL